MAEERTLSEFKARLIMGVTLIAFGVLGVFITKPSTKSNKPETKQNIGQQK